MTANEFLDKKGISNSDFMDDQVADMIEKLILEYAKLYHEAELKKLRVGDVRQRFIIKAIIDGKEFFPKGFYYQGNFIILVGCEIENHTIRRKEKIADVEIAVTENVA